MANSLSWPERLALLVAIIEIPLQLDKFFFFHESDSLLGAVGGLSISLTTLSLIFLYGVWAANTALHRSRLAYRCIFGYPMIVYLTIVLASAMWATKPALSLFDFAVLVHAYLLFFYVANRLQTHSDVQFILFGFALTMAIQSGLIFYAGFLGIETERYDLGPITLTVNEGQRHGGTMHSPVLAGSTLAMLWLPVLASLTVLKEKRSWCFAFVAVVMGVVAIFLTQTRGAILTSVVGMSIIGGGMLMRGWLPKWTIVLAGVLVIVSIYPAIIVYEKRVQFGDGDSARARKHLSAIALELISQHPMLGHGSGNCHLAGQNIADRGEFRGEWYYTVHSKYLLVWIETGVFGFIAFLAVIGNALRQSMAAWLTKDGALAVIGLAFFASISGHMLHLAVDIFNSRTQVQILWLLFGMSAAVYKLSNHERFARRAPTMLRRAG
ncbi:O-antigen ligase family protein [Novipirellula aureliae]|nr:O-antigen ligase family protein [Novipirellula aureliae]